MQSSKSTVDLSKTQDVTFSPRDYVFRVDDWEKINLNGSRNAKPSQEIDLKHPSLSTVPHRTKSMLSKTGSIDIK